MLDQLEEKLGVAPWMFVDAFNQAGVEIMTPMVHGIRNQPGLTTPQRSEEDVGAFRFASLPQRQD